MQNSMAVITVFLFYHKCFFWENLVENVKIVSVKWNLIPRLIRIYRIQWGYFLLEMPFLGKFGLNCQYCQFKVKLNTKTNLNIWKSMVVFTFFVFDQKCPFWTNLFQNVKIISLSWNLVSRLIWICRIQWCCSIFLFPTENSLFGQIWSEKSKLTTGIGSKIAKTMIRLKNVSGTSFGV